MLNFNNYLIDSFSNINIFLDLSNDNINIERMNDDVVINNFSFKEEPVDSNYKSSLTNSLGLLIQTSNGRVKHLEQKSRNIIDNKSVLKNILALSLLNKVNKLENIGSEDSFYYLKELSDLLSPLDNFISLAKELKEKKIFLSLKKDYLMLFFIISAIHNNLRTVKKMELINIVNNIKVNTDKAWIKIIRNNFIRTVSMKTGILNKQHAFENALTGASLRASSLYIYKKKKKLNVEPGFYGTIWDRFNLRFLELQAQCSFLLEKTSRFTNNLNLEIKLPYIDEIIKEQITKNGDFISVEETGDGLASLFVSKNNEDIFYRIKYPSSRNISALSFTKNMTIDEMRLFILSLNIVPHELKFL